jgi:hypothetical protein
VVLVVQLLSRQNLQKHLEYKDETIAGKAIAWCYGTGFGILHGLMSQWLKVKVKKDDFLLLNLIMVFIFLNAFNISTTTFFTHYAFSWVSL